MNLTSVPWIIDPPCGRSLPSTSSLKPEKPSSAVVDISVASGFGCATGAGGFATCADAGFAACVGGFAVVCADGVTGGVRFTCRGGTFTTAGSFSGAGFADCFAACRFVSLAILCLLQLHR